MTKRKQGNSTTTAEAKLTAAVAKAKHRPAITRTGRLSLTPQEVAEELRISRAHVYALMAGGELSSFHIGRKRRIPASSIDAFVERQLEAERHQPEDRSA